MSNTPISAEQLAELLAMNVKTIHKLTRDGQLPHHRIGVGTIRYTLSDVLAYTAVNQHPDDDAVDRFAQAMHEKMAAARAKGKEGWDDPERCSLQHLHALFDDAAGNLEYVDAANYAMMLWARGEK